VHRCGLYNLLKNSTILQMSTGSFPGSSGRGVALTIHRLLAPGSSTGRFIPVPPIYVCLVSNWAAITFTLPTPHAGPLNILSRQIKKSHLCKEFQTDRSLMDWNMGWTSHCLNSRKGKRFFLLQKSTPVLEPNQPPIEWVPGVLSLSIKAAEA